MVAGARSRDASHRSRPCTRRQTLPGLGAKTTYLHSQGTVGFDWRTSPGYSRRGGFYGVTLHDYTDSDKAVRLPAGRLRSDPALSDPARSLGHLASRPGARPTFNKSDQQIPFFMLPSVGGGSTLRGFSSWRFRDRNSLLLQAEWRIMVNRFLDTAVFYDAGKVTARTVRSRFRRAEERLRLRAPFSRTVRHAAARRTGQEQRRSGPRLLVVRGLLRLPAMSTSSFASRARPRAGVLVLRRRARPVRQRRLDHRVRTSIRTIRSRANRSRRTRRRRSPTRSGRCTRWSYNLFVTSGYKPSGTRAKNINTIDEVPDSSWFTNRIGTTADHGRRARARPQSRRPTRPVTLGA